MNAHYVLGELTRRPSRLIVGVMTVAVGVALFLSLQAYSAGYQKAARVPLSEIGADIVAQRQGTRPEAFEGIVFPHSTAPLHRDEIEAISRIPGVIAAGETVFFWSFESDERFIVGLGLDPAQSVGPGRLRAALRSGRFIEPGEQGVAVADSNYASEKKLEIGSKVTMSGRSFEVVGLVDTSRAGQVANANLYIPLAEAQEMSTSSRQVRAVHDFRPNDANILFIRADPAQGPAIAEQVKKLLGDQAIVTTPRSFDRVLGSTFSLIDRFGLMVGLAGLLVTMLGLLRTTAAGLWERRRDVGLLTAIGWRRRDVVAQLLAESFVLTALGGFFGLLLAIIVSWGLGFSRVTVPVPWELSPTPMFVPGGPMKMAVTVPMDASISPEMAAAALTMVIIGAELLSLWLARRAARVRPAEVLRNE